MLSANSIAVWFCPKHVQTMLIYRNPQANLSPFCSDCLKEKAGFHNTTISMSHRWWRKRLDNEEE